MEQSLKLIMDELKIIREDLVCIKKAIPDKDMFLTAEESQLLKESYRREKEGKLISSKKLRVKLGI